MVGVGAAGGVVVTGVVGVVVGVEVAGVDEEEDEGKTQEPVPVKK